LLTAIGLTRGGSIEYTHTNNTQNNASNLGRVRAVPRLCELYPGICFATKEKARKNLSQGSRRVPVSAMLFTKTLCLVVKNMNYRHVQFY
jgi:hypothetical protein